MSIPYGKKPLGGDVIKSDSGAYIKNHNAKAKLVIEAAEQLTHSTRVQVRGLGTENFSAKCIWFHRWTWNSDELVLESSPLYNSVNFYDPFHITWSYRVAKPSGGWGDWIQMNRSSHILYTVNAQPAASRLYEQGVDKACRYASGAADFAAAINSGLANEIYYDPTRESPHDLDIYDEGRGQCCCHAHVLVLLISHVTDVSPSPEFVWGGCSNSVICFYRHETGWWGPSFQCQRPAVDNAEANPHFTFHVVVPFAGTIYDPSYGVTGHAPFLETAPAHPEAASFQSGSALPVAAHYVDWTCGPH